MKLDRVMKAFGQSVKKTRIARDLTQEDMTNLGFNYRYYQKIEAGQVNVTLGTLARLASALKCKISDFF